TTRSPISPVTDPARLRRLWVSSNGLPPEVCARWRRSWKSDESKASSSTAQDTSSTFSKATHSTWSERSIRIELWTEKARPVSPGSRRSRRGPSAGSQPIFLSGAWPISSVATGRHLLRHTPGGVEEVGEVGLTHRRGEGSEPAWGEQHAAVQHPEEELSIAP